MTLGFNTAHQYMRPLAVATSCWNFSRADFTLEVQKLHGYFKQASHLRNTVSMKIQLLAQVKSTVYDRLAQHNLDFLLGIVKALPLHKRHIATLEIVSYREFALYRDVI